MSHSELGSSDFRSQTSRAPPKVPQMPCKARARKDAFDEWSETDSDDEDGHGELTFDAAAPAASACESRLHMLYKDDAGSEVHPTQKCNPCTDKGEDTGMSFRQMVEQAKEVKAFVKDTVKQYGVPCDADQLFADWWSCAAALRTKPTFAKGDKAARMLELLQTGTGVTSLHPAQYELLHEARASITSSTLAKAGRKGAEWWPRFLSFLVAVGQVAETRVPLSGRPAPRPSKQEVEYEAEAVLGGFDRLQRVWRRDPALRAVHGVRGGNVNVEPGRSQLEREEKQKQDLENFVQSRIDGGGRRARTAYGNKAPFHTARRNRRRQRQRRRIQAAQMSPMSRHALSSGSSVGSELSSGSSGDSELSSGSPSGSELSGSSLPPFPPSSGDWSSIFAPALWKAQDMAVKLIGQDGFASAQASGGDKFVALAEVFINSQRLPQPVPLWETTRKVVQYITSQADVPADQLLLVPFGRAVPTDMSGAYSLQSLQLRATASGSGTPTADRFCDFVDGLAQSGDLLQWSTRGRGLWKVALVTARSLAAPVGKTHHDHAADIIAAGFVAAVSVVAAIGWQIVRAQRRVIAT